MAVPTFDKFIDPVLRFLATRPDGALARDAYQAAARALNLSDADCQELLPSGTQPIYKNRTGWAHDRLKRLGFSSSPRRGYWRLTAKGHAFLENNSGPLSEEQADTMALGLSGDWHDS